MDATDLARYIDTRGIAAEIILLEDQTPTVEAAAAAAGVRPPQIVKSVLFVVKTGATEEASKPRYSPVLVVANGLSRISYKRLADHLDVSRRRVRIARPKQVLHYTGYQVGTVPPFGHCKPVPTLLDRAVLGEEELLAGGGADNALLRLSVAEMRRVLDAPVVDVVER